MVEVLLAKAVPLSRAEILPIPRDGHVAGDGADDDRYQRDDGENALNDNDDDADNRCRNALQVEADVECGTEGDARDFTETETV